MKTIVAKPITLETFRKYGEFVDIINPEGESFGDYYRDNVTLPPTISRVAFSPSICHKQDFLVQFAEYHDYGCECILPLDDDGIIHLAPASKTPVPEKTEAFILKKGTMIRLNPGVWHAGFMPLNKETAHVLIILPERSYVTDCHEAHYDESDWMEVELP